MNTNELIPYDLYFSNILPYIFEDPKFDLRIFLKNALINKWWRELIYSYDFINVMLKTINIKRPKKFNDMINSTHRMKLALNKIYVNDISLQNDIIPDCNSINDLVISNSFKIIGNIEKIQLYTNEIINLDVLNNIVYKDLSKLNIYTEMPHYPNNKNIWKLNIYLEYEIPKKIKTLELFSTNKPENYNFKIFGKCKIEEIQLYTNLYREMYLNE